MRPSVAEFGIAVEGMFSAIIKKAQWTRCALRSKKELLQTMQAINPKRLTSCLRALESAGEDLTELTARDIMDYVYGVDFLIQFESINGNVTVAIDVTSDAGKVSEKAEKLLSLKPAIKAGLGADLALVVLVDADRKAFGLLSEAKQYQIIGHISDRIDALVIKGKWCGSVTL